MNTLGEKVSINDGEIPSVFLCPITDDVMRTPVVARDGFTYDESALIKWVRQSATSPLTRETIEEYDWIIDRSLANRIDKWMGENPSYHPAADLPLTSVVRINAEDETSTENNARTIHNVAAVTMNTFDEEQRTARSAITEQVSVSQFLVGVIPFTALMAICLFVFSAFIAVLISLNAKTLSAEGVSTDDNLSEVIVDASSCGESKNIVVQVELTSDRYTIGYSIESVEYGNSSKSLPQISLYNNSLHFEQCVPYDCYNFTIVRNLCESVNCGWWKAQYNIIYDDHKTIGSINWYPPSSKSILVGPCD